MTLSNEQLQALARHGAEARIQELEAEIATIKQSFGLAGARRGRPPGRRSARRAASSTEPRQVRKRGRRRRSHMSAEARKAQSERMKKYWAARRAAKAGKKK